MADAIGYDAMLFPRLPIPLAWRATICRGCGQSVRRMRLGTISVMLDPRPVSVIAERFGGDGAVAAYEHRVGYEPHRCAATAETDDPVTSSDGAETEA